MSSSSANKEALSSNEDNNDNSISKYLTKDPQMTYFKSVFRKHTNFSFDWKLLNTEKGDVDFGKKITFKLSNTNYDMLQDCVLKIVLPQIFSSSNSEKINWIDKVGHAIIKRVTLKIGNDEVISSYTGEYLEIVNQLNMQNEKLETYFNMIGSNKSLLSKVVTTSAYALYIPLIFWFNKDIGLSLPLCAIRTHDIIIDVELQDLNKLYHKYNNSISVNVVSGQQLKANLLCKYYKLSDIERNRFTHIDHKYLIEQVQEIERTVTAAPNQEISIPLTGFKLPVKELLWTTQPDDFYNNSNTFRLHANNSADYNTPFLYSHTSEEGAGKNFCRDFSLNIHGMPYFENMEPQVFNMYLPYKYHNRSPDAGIFIYPFSEKPNEYQPSGCVNFTRLSSNDTVLRIKFNDLINSFTGSKVVKIKIYAINYNIFNIKNGATTLSFFE